MRKLKFSIFLFVFLFFFSIAKMKYWNTHFSSFLWLLPGFVVKTSHVISHQDLRTADLIWFLFIFHLLLTRCDLFPSLDTGFFFRFNTTTSLHKQNTKKKSAKRFSEKFFRRYWFEAPLRARDRTRQRTQIQKFREKKTIYSDEWMNELKKEKKNHQTAISVHIWRLFFFFKLLNSYFTFYNFMSYRIKLFFSLLFAFSSSQHKCHTFSFTINFPCLDCFFWLCSFFSFLFMHRTLKSSFLFLLFFWFSTEIFFFLHVATEAQYPFDVHP